MEETFKKLIYAGVGLAAQATERIEETINDLISKGKITDKEGKKIVDDFIKKTEDKKESYETKFKTAVEDVTSRFNYVKKADYDVLAKKVAKLEKEMKAQKAPAKRTATKKTVAKKTTANTTATAKA